MATMHDSIRAGGLIQGPLTLRPRMAGEIPLDVQGVAGQTARLQRWRDSAGTEVAYIDNSGNLYLAGTATVVVNEAITGDISLTGTLAVTGATTLSSTLSVTGNLTTSAALTIGTNATFGGITSAPAMHLRLRTAAPAAVGSNGILYTANGDTDTTELWYKDAAGNTVQITDAGALEGSSLFWDDDEYIRMGNTAASPDVRFGWNTAQTVDALFLGLSDGQNTFIIAENGDRAFDFAHGAATNPTLFIHSAVQNTAQWISATHNQTDAVIGTGAGDLLLTIAGGNLAPSANDGFALGTATLGVADIFLATGAVINWNNGEVTITETDANTLTLVGATLIDISAGIFELNDAVRFDTGVAMVAASYSVGRDADATNQLHFNVPTGATFEFSVNDAVEMTLSATAVNFQNNTITTTGGGSLTGTWSDLGSVTTIDINGGTIDGTVIGGAVAAALTATTGTFSGQIAINHGIDAGAGGALKLNRANDVADQNFIVFDGQGGANQAYIGTAANQTTTLTIGVASGDRATLTSAGLLTLTGGLSATTGTFSSTVGINGAAAGASALAIKGVAGTTNSSLIIHRSENSNGAFDVTQDVGVAGNTVMRMYNSAGAQGVQISSLSQANTYFLNSAVLLGSVTAYGRLGQLFEINTSAADGGIALNTWAVLDAAAIIDFNKSDSNTIGTHTVVADGETLGALIFRGSDGVSAFRNAAQIKGLADTGTQSATSMPGMLAFYTTPDASVTLVERMRIDSAGLTRFLYAAVPHTNDGAALGSTTLGWADIYLATGANILVNNANAKRTMVLTAAGGTPTTTAGCAAATKVEAGTNDIDYYVLDFDTTSAESAFWNVVMPTNYDGGTVTAKFYWTTASGLATETVDWDIQGLSLANDDAIDAAYGSAVTTTDTFIAQGDLHVSAESTAITIAGTPAAGENVIFKVTRKVSTDNLTGDARLMQVKILYGINTYSD